MVVVFLVQTLNIFTLFPMENDSNKILDSQMMSISWYDDYTSMLADSTTLCWFWFVTTSWPHGVVAGLRYFLLCSVVLFNMWNIMEQNKVTSLLAFNNWEAHSVRNSIALIVKVSILVSE